MQHEGPYRNQFDLEAAAIRRLEQKINKEEGVFSLRLPENIKEDDEVPFFKDAVNNPEFGPKKIVLYSLATGILRYCETGPQTSKSDFFYKYNDPENNPVGITVLYNKKEKPPARINIISTKSDAERVRSQSEEFEKIKLTNIFDKEQENIRDITQLIETGVIPPAEDLHDLKTDVERLLFVINERLEEKK